MTESLEKSKQKLKAALERLEKAVDGTLAMLESARKNHDINDLANSSKDLSVDTADTSLFDDSKISDVVSDMETLSLSIQDLKKSVGK